MFRLSIIIGVLLISFLGYNEANATYIPGATIAMTGSNSSVRFDIASDLFNSGATATRPVLVTATKMFSGVFYGSGIGWIEFSTGAYQVSLDCGVQSLGSLSANCTLTGTGWSENVGDIYFNSGSTVIYNPTTGYLSGSIISFVGNIDLTGIALPLRPVTINESDIMASGSMNITVSGSSLYDGGNSAWNMQVTPLASADTRNIGGTNGIFPVDLSLATTYLVSIFDTNNSETQFPLLVSSGLPTTTRISGTYADTFCASNPADTRCPDGATRIASSLTKSPVIGSLIANGTDTYSLTMQTRDAYGNRVLAGDIAIRYVTTVKNIQSDISENINYGPSMDGDAFISSDLTLNLFGSSAVSTGSLGAGDIIYTIASSAPTDNANNIIRLDSIRYISGSINIPITPANISPTLSFAPLFIVSTDSINTPIVDTPNIFTGIVTKNDPATTIVPDIVTTLKIGPTGVSSVWTGITSDPVALCTNYYLKPSTENSLCDWTDIYMSSLTTPTDTGFTFTGTYSPIMPFTLIEPTTIGTYVHYMNGATEILYPLPDNIINGPTLTTPRLKVVGQSSSNMDLGSQNRINIINSLREKISLLGRNRADYTNTDYVIYTGNQIITDASFASKRTIITIGGDITISSDISLHAHPLAIIALTNNNNIGGNIIIDSTVTDIHSILIAEHGITSGSSTSQLYIHGSMISSNPPQESIPTSCPYFALACTPADYDLPGQRSGYVTPTGSSVGGSAYASPLVIQYDTRLIGDPPPAMNK